MTVQMNWEDMTFKSADVVKLIIGLFALILAMAKVNGKLDNVGESQDLMRSTQIEFIKDYNLNQKATESRLNAIELNQKISDMRIEAIEKSNANRK